MFNLTCPRMTPGCGSPIDDSRRRQGVDEALSTEFSRPMNRGHRLILQHAAAEPETGDLYPHSWARECGFLIAVPSFATDC